MSDNEKLLKKAKSELRKFVNSNYRILNFAPPMIIREANRLEEQVKIMENLVAEEGR